MPPLWRHCRPRPGSRNSRDPPQKAARQQLQRGSRPAPRAPLGPALAGG